MDQSVLESLSTPKRQKVTRQLRKEQVKRYLDFIKQENVRQERKENRKKTKVAFKELFLLQEAVENFDDREVARLLNRGVDKNFRTGNDTTLLHKCVEEENYSTAEMLISEGADINAADTDGWTPLHMACHFQVIDMVQLLLSNGADICTLDVDGFFPKDHAPENSETREMIEQHMEKIGVSEKDLEEKRLKIPREMYTDVKDHLSHGGSPNKENENGITLLHIACANGYRKVIRLLLKHGADVNQADNFGWTSLHIASRFNQMRILQTLLKCGADPMLTDGNGCTPSQVATDDNIRALLTKAERKQRKRLSWRESELPDNLENDTDEMDTGGKAMMGHLVRINSKNVRSRHTTLAKEDGLLELNQREAQEVVGADDSDVTPTADVSDVTQTADDEYEEIYVSKIWRNVNKAKDELPPIMDSDNLTDLASITEKAILENILKRFNAGQIYTYIGNILVAVNPFKEMNMYSKKVSQKYHSKSSVPLPPHVYGVAERAHQSLLMTNSSQCFVISGESGAGKTETCKYLVQHLVFIAGSEESNLNGKISQVNPVLEAFGNARTLVNSNSSRFAKFMQLSFNGKGRIVGANLTEFLLEKSRVVCRGEGELNFHIFYWMFSGISPEEANLYHLTDISTHRYLAQPGSEAKSLMTTANKEKFWELKECLHNIGFTSEEIQSILLLLAALLHLGDITFGCQGNHDAAIVNNHDKLNLVSGMLEVSSQELGSALVAEYSVMRGEQIRKDRTRQQAGDCRDALAKAIYSRLFSWIVNGINQMTQPIDPSSDNGQIGILDIFGFENFNRNSFEQMCINLANEQMQSYTNDYIFLQEQRDCLLEGVPLVELNYKNNQPIIDTFLERNVGILAILDEESRFPKGTDLTLATKLHQGPGAKYSEVYKVPRDNGPSFTVVHYAGVVKYDLIGVLEKNRDTLPNAVLCTMKTSDSLLVKELFQSRMSRTGSLAPSTRQQRSRKSRQSPFDFFKKLKAGKSKKKTVTPVVPYEKKGPSTMAYHFKNSLSDLMTRIQASSPHIIRCVRPNIHRMPLHFIPDYVLAQLRYTGITETIKIKKHGYCSRLKFRDFLVVYETLRTLLVPPHSMIPDEEKCRDVISYCGLSTDAKGHKFGKSKVFFHEADMKKIDEVSKNVKKKVILCQSAVRRYLAKKKYVKLQKISSEKNGGKVRELCQQVALEHDKVTSWIQFQREQDKRRHHDQKATEERELEGSVESLDQVLSQYEDVNQDEDNESGEEDDSYADVLNVMTANMSVQQGRGLPPPPCGATISRDNPPLNPREMYAQSGIYQVIQDEKAARRPAPPKRSASTRLSSGRDRVSVSSDDSVFLDEHRKPTNQHSPHLSPRLSRASQQLPQGLLRRSSSPGKSMQPSPSTGQARPFSYISPPPNTAQPPHNPSYLGSPGSPTYEQPHPTHSHNGHQHRPRVSSNVEVRSVPPTQQDHHHRSSRGGRQSLPVTPVTPPQQHVRDANFPQHVIPLNPQHVRDANFPQHVKPLGNQQPGVSHGHEMVEPTGKRQRAPSFPAPPPPFAGSIRSMGSKRSPSPPLPPPPLDPSARPANIVQNPDARHTRVSEPPTPPPISKIPGTRSSVSSFELGKRNREGSVDNSPVQSPTHHTGYKDHMDQSSLASQLHKVKLKTAATPEPSDKKNFQQQVAMGIAAELGTVQLRSGTKDVPREKTRDESRETSPEALLKKLNPVKRPEGSRTSPERVTMAAVNFLSKLKPTGGLKPWEKDTSPPTNNGGDDDVMTTSLDDVPLPPEPLTELSPEEGELPLPPPPPVEDSEPVQTGNPVVMDMPSKSSKDENLKKKKIFEQEKNDIGDNMDIDLDEIDYSQIPGYVPITNAVPNWKKDMIIKKNEEKVKEYVEELRRKKAEAMKWKDVPEWKRKMLEKKEQQKREQEVAMTQAAEEKAKAKTTKVKPVLQKRQSFDETQTTNNSPSVAKSPVSPVPKQPANPPVAKQPVKPPVSKQPETPPGSSMPNNNIDVNQTISVEQLDLRTVSPVLYLSENVTYEKQKTEHSEKGDQMNMDKMSSQDIEECREGVSSQPGDQNKEAKSHDQSDKVRSCDRNDSHEKNHSDKLCYQRKIADEREENESVDLLGDRSTDHDDIGKGSKTQSSENQSNNSKSDEVCTKGGSHDLCSNEDLSHDACDKDLSHEVDTHDTCDRDALCDEKNRRDSDSTEGISIQGHADTVNLVSSP
uniref:Unconventional myosin-XVI-like isoform X4 n=1 Tax=Crassostrea virginica TaxID=6565 RepID=A0A8B8EUN3_CRAVI|nr:unconventional myosin-XVI-like isoform X4 [Crassostrea virginica]